MNGRPIEWVSMAEFAERCDVADGVLRTITLPPETRLTVNFALALIIHMTSICPNVLAAVAESVRHTLESSPECGDA